MEVRLGTLTDYLVLSEDPYLIRFDAPTPADGADTRVVACELQMAEGTPDALWGKARQAVQEMLNRAAAAIDENKPMSERVAFQVRLGTTDWSYFDVRSGRLDGFDHHATGISTYLTMTLTCLPYVRGEAIAVSNLLSASCDPEADAWALTNVTATSNNVTAPDGSETAARLRETSATGAHEMRQQIAKPAESAPYTLSAYVKADGRSAVSLYLADGSGTNGAYVGFDVVAGYRLYPPGTSGTGFSGASAAIENADDGWYRVSLTATVNTDTALRAYIQLHDGSGTSYAGNASLGLLVWGAQLEESDSAGLLLVLQMLPDTVREAYTIPGWDVPAVPAVWANDSDNLISTPATWSLGNVTETASQPDGSGGTGARRFTEQATSGQHWARSSQATVSGVATAAVYLKRLQSAKVRMLFSGTNTGTGYMTTIDFDAVTVSTPTLVGGTGYSGASAEIVDMDNDWFWVRLTQTMPSTSSASVYIVPSDNAPASTFSGSTSHDVRVWRVQIVSGSTIDRPAPEVPASVVPDELVPAETVQSGALAGAYLYGIPGDADAVYRVEVDDASSGAAVDRLHIGSWSGEDVRLDQPPPFITATPAEGASSLSDGDGYVGDSVATAGVGPTWQPIAQIALEDLTGRRGLADLRVRVRDRSPYLSSPASIRAEVIDATSMRRLGRAASPAQDSVTSLGLGRPLVTPGSTLVLLCQWTSLSVTSATLNGGGGTWASRTGGDNGRVHFRWWTLEDADQLSSGLSVSWASGVVYAAVTLLEISGVAAASYDVARVDTVAPRTGEASDHITTGSITAAQANSILLSVGIGTKYINNPLTAVTTPSTYRAVSTLASGGVAALSVSSTGPHTARWERMLADAEPEGWIALLAAFKSATMSAADLTPGQWSLCMTAVDADGNESLPTGIVSVSVPSAGSSVHISGTAPLIGTAAAYRHYRNRGSGWGYLETSVPAHVWTSEGSVTPADPPTTDIPVAAWRVAIALPSGERAWHAQVVRSSQRANGAWEDIDAGSLPLPPIVAGEGETPTGALIQIEAAHLEGTTVDVNGVWLYGAADGQVVASRSPDDEGDARGWVLDTTRDQTLAAWLRDAVSGIESGQPAARGRLTVQPGRALIVLRPEMAGARSDLIASDLQIRRILVTPRWHYIAGRPS